MTETVSITTKITKKIKKGAPVPTDWIIKTPEGSPPPGVLLIILASDPDEDIPSVDLGYFSERLNTYITLDNIAIEEQSEVYAYHICHTPRRPVVLLMS